MRNPWQAINIEVYENNMSSETAMQLQVTFKYNQRSDGKGRPVVELGIMRINIRIYLKCI